MARKKTPIDSKLSGPKSEVEAIRHDLESRPNIPTQELRSFAAQDEAKPKTMLYPRDPSLDPQLVWKGKDEQDAEPLAVDVVPIYIQEAIEPKAIIDAVRGRPAQEGKGERKASQMLLPGLFGDDEPMDFDRKVEFYQHPQRWANRMILGDSLVVMNSLAEKEGLRGKVQMIYFDPPYGIKFGSNWQVSTRKKDIKDGRPEEVTSQPEQLRAFRDTWRIGVHSYLAYLRDRFCIARDLLSESGSIFVQIGDENVHLVRSLLDEIFGSENFCSHITYRTSVPLTSIGLAGVADHIVWYSKNRETYKFRDLFVARETGDKSRFTNVELPDGQCRSLTAQERMHPERLPEGSRIFSDENLVSSGYTKTCIFDFEYRGKKYSTSSGKSWKTTRSGMEQLAKVGRISDRGTTLRYVFYLNDFPVMKLTNFWLDTTGEQDKSYVVQTHNKVIERCLLMTTDPGDLVLDPTCGSGTTAYVAEQWGRRWITIDTSRVALALARTRLMAGRYPYYLLNDSPAGQLKEAELAGREPTNYLALNDIRKGFVYKRVPHVTLKSIANNPDIREGMTRAEIDAAIARHADTETLYDQPYEDKSRIRVSGPFTVESLSPDRIIDPDDQRPAAETNGQNQPGRPQFESMILENLRKSGLKTTLKAERLEFDRLEHHAGEWIHGTGDYTDADGKSRRVAVTIGPEHGTVTPEHVKEAAKEALRGVGSDMLIVCGFAFDPYVGEEAKHYGRLQVIPARMNPDLLMGDALKATGAGNLFMVFGEPDLDVTRDADGKVIVEIKGVDVYDPTTRQIRSSSTDDIACWFIDTNYNGECFYVRHAYFLGADDPYNKLKRALKAEIDETQWATLYSTKSYPFDPPATGKIAVKVINHYGDEVLKVYPIKA